eukprot:CAMPEP_0197690668 /NCGR_PEP_ID=MMETSP1338-20131121/108671_1 /TAXON_ID=43686 ORGANISM="Pelagodinium beii, Strain RCC1491" /NCGR_SAMPLE_ID=MMETSP1338 /ASSEMBLY_ACC=CAM_ASM_000754 /LENGTH=70 /DNA_ID=CAMNT_0043273135 /DNA_START=580 /DNA_END=793 /DNA_ORIENTATION=+
MEPHESDVLAEPPSSSEGKVAQLMALQRVKISVKLDFQIRLLERLAHEISGSSRPRIWSMTRTESMPHAA